MPSLPLSALPVALLMVLAGRAPVKGAEQPAARPRPLTGALSEGEGSYGQSSERDSKKARGQDALKGGTNAPQV